MKYIPDRWTNGPSATYEELVKLLGGPKGNATSNELEALLASERKALVELGLDAKRPPGGGRSQIAPEIAAPLPLTSDAMVADGSGVLHINKENPE
ncbi:MAG TPA: hypothetical protein VJ140_14035 [Actinomycetota bacterium]|nr:hypothetical protein [Actinomycetota bacterium]